MKSILLALAIAFYTLPAGAQTKVSLQASGLTCSMCSKAVLTALQEVSFVEKVQVDIKNQQYHISFKQNQDIDFDALAKAVEDAGFSVASFKVTMDVGKLKLDKDQHVQIGKQYFHFLNAAGQELNGTTTFSIVDKQYTPAKDFKKYSSMTKMSCVQTGKAGACCSKGELNEETRIYHAII